MGFFTRRTIPHFKCKSKGHLTPVESKCGGWRVAYVGNGLFALQQKQFIPGIEGKARIWHPVKEKEINGRWVWENYQRPAELSEVRQQFELRDPPKQYSV